MPSIPPYILFFFFNDTATTEIYTLSLHDALPIFEPSRDKERPTRIVVAIPGPPGFQEVTIQGTSLFMKPLRSEEHTSELQSLAYLVCRLLLEKKKKKTNINTKYKNKIQTLYTYNITTPVFIYLLFYAFHSSLYFIFFF